MIPTQKCYVYSGDPESGYAFDACEFCKKITVRWHLKSNNPVCQVCSKAHKVTELKNWFLDGKPYKYHNKVRHRRNDK